MTTKIQWCDEVWNVVTGCTHSGMPGCDFCYARRLFPRVYGNAAPAHMKSPRKFSDVQTHPDRLDKPLHWRKPRRVFVCSMGDLFHETVPFHFIDKALSMMALCPHHTFQVLTKRPGITREYFTSHQKAEAMFAGEANAEWLHGFLGWERFHRDVDKISNYFRTPGTSRPNLWLGASASTQPDLERVVPDLLATPAAVRFLSLEPLLGRVDIGPCFPRHIDACPGCGARGPFDDCCTTCGDIPTRVRLQVGLDWAIVGCESGPKRRPCKPEDARSVIEQCQAAGVPVFHKQMDIDGHVSKDMAEWPEWARVRKFPC